MKFSIKIKKSQRFLYGGLLLFTFLIHSTYLPNGFTWLDHRDIVEGRAVLPINKLHKAVITRYGDTGFYRPVVTITNSLDAAVYKGFAPGYHLTNVLLFVAIIAAVPFFLQAFFAVSFGEALFAALIVSVHPLSFLPVGSISYRPELLFTLFSLFTILFYIKFKVRKTIRYLPFAIFSFSLALLSKETTLILVPAAILFWELSQHVSLRERMTKQSHTKRILFAVKNRVFFIEIASFLAMTLVYVFLRLHAVPEIWRISVSFPSESTAIGTRLNIVGKLLTHFFSPFLPSISDATPIVTIVHPAAFIPLVVLFFLLVALFRIGVKKPLGRALGLFLVFLTPAASIVPVPRMASPHYGFIALIPFSALTVVILEWLIGHDRIREYIRWRFYRGSFHSRMTTAIFFLWLIIASVMTFISGSRFRTDATLFTPDVTHDVNFHEGQFYLGNYYLRQKDLTQAETAYKAALTPSTSFLAYRESVSTLTNLAAVYYAQKAYRKADQVLAEAQARANRRDVPSILYNRALLASEQKNYQKVVDLLYKTNDMNPVTLLLLADALHNLRRDKEAREILQQSLPLWPAEQQVKIKMLIQNISQ